MPIVLETIAPRDADSKSYEAVTAYLETCGARMLQALRLQRWELSVVVCHDEHIRGLNREHRGIDGATDVLAFPMFEREQLLALFGQSDSLEGDVPRNNPRLSQTLDVALLGDVIISLETAKRQAQAAGRELKEEALFLLAHGVLHLLGEDHRDHDEERRMMARTDILRSVARG